MRWKRTQFCRGWLITGDTGSGKTSSGINQLAHQVFQNESKWGGLCIDEKGVYWETLAAMAKHYEREQDLIHLQIRADDTNTQWTPPHRFNLTGDRSIPFTTYAKFVVDTANSLGQGGDKGFFKSQAQTHIAHALEFLFELKRPVTLAGAFQLLSNQDQIEEEIENLGNLLETPRRIAVREHFKNRFLNQPEEQQGGVRETIGNYLQYFLTPEIAEVFCTGESTFNFAAIDQGKIILTTMQQKFQTERRYVNTFLKLLYYSHALRRFDKSKAARANDNLLILWADEAQRFMTASEDGTSDYNCVDVIREAGATIVAAAQSTTSLVPPLGNDKSRVLTLNLRNRLIFRAADEADAVQSADFLGKKRVVK
ncbi:MAG: type IV secretion system DNA-binding domain-containing protein, partial [Verrucomicrobiota bacterium]